MSFVERQSGAEVAVASTHFVRSDTHLNAAARETKAAEWAEKLTKNLDRYAAATAVLGGDFNIQRCFSQQSLPLVPTPSREPQTCDTRSWWTTLVSRGYQDNVYEQHGNPARLNTQADLDKQYEDGCSQLNSSGGCEIQHFREKRIDFIFTTSPAGPSSHDLTCGQDHPAPGANPPNCDNLSHPRRYSDHRLVWSLVST
ncbi:MAG: hypothetical protein H0U53_06855 [Actinobacteria bacterium]|nr:hypothetical protein [Actinomycetota bacterium]